MKKIILLSAIFVLALNVSAQVPFSLTEGECAIVYALPKTEICIEVQTEKVTQTPGMFYRYSERYLGTTKVITTEKTVYRLKSLMVKPRAIPDPNRTFKFIQDKNSGSFQLSVNSQGLLCGVNVPCQPEAKPVENSTIPPIEKTESPSLLPLGEEYMMAGSEAKLAEGAAKQIYHIRESRLGLMTADVDKLPADGASFSAMLEGLNKKESELTELFVGKTTTETQSQQIILTPDSAMTNQVLFRVSALRGLVAADDLGGSPYYINIKPTVTRVVAADSKSKPEVAALYTIFPAATQVTIGDGINTYFSGQFFIPQFGKIVPVSENVFKQKNLKIRIDQQTGRLLEIE